MKKAILIIIAVIIVAAAVYVYLKQTGSLPAGNQPPQNNQTDGQTDNQTQWKNYKNTQYGFEIFYPPQYSFNEGASQRFNVGEFFVGSGQNIATISLPENSYPGTNYFDAFLTISVSPAGISEASCRQAQREGDSQITNLTNPETINNVTFYRGQTSGAAAGTLAQSRIYHAFVVDKCHEVTLNLFEGNIGNYPADSVSQVDENDVFSKLEAVLKTIKITSPPPVTKSQNEITPEQFVKNYLDAYKNIMQKKNFAEVKSFLTADALIFMQSEGVPLETNYTNFDSYQILSVENLGNHYVSKVKLFSKGDVLKKPDGSDTTEIDIIRQGANWKAETWYFTQ
jgi:hypothetical protein